MVCPCDVSGKKQDIWYVIDLLTGEKQQTLSSAFADSLCPSTSLLYLGRTGKKKPLVLHKPACFPRGLNWPPPGLCLRASLRRRQPELFSGTDFTTWFPFLDPLWLPLPEGYSPICTQPQSLQLLPLAPPPLLRFPHFNIFQ